MRKCVFAVLIVLLVSLVWAGMSGCGTSNNTAEIVEEEPVEEGDLTVDYSTDAAKSVDLPTDYPKDSFPIFKNAYIMTVQSFENSFVVVAFCKEPIREVGAFYKDLFKDSQVIASTEREDEYTVMGSKDNYTYSVTVLESDEVDGYPTSLAISLVPSS